SHGATLTGLASGTLYHYQVKSRDPAGNLTFGGDFTFTTLADTTPPSAPATLTATASTSGYTISLSWAAAADDAGVTGYRVERCQAAGCTRFVHAAPPTATNDSNMSLRPSAR